MQNKLFVGSLSWNTNEDGLREHFSSYGDMDEVKIITDRETGRSRGFGFITFANQSDAESALELDSSELDGRTIKVNVAKEKAPRRGGGGGGGGRNRW